jgi:hypothetical protein
MAQETRDAELVALAAIVMQDAAFIPTGRSPNLDARAELEHELRERGRLPWPPPKDDSVPF